MKNINLLTTGQSVIFSANLAEFIIKEIKPEKETVLICIDGAPETQREAKMAHVYPATEHVKEVSEFTKKTRDLLKMQIPFGVKINEKIMNKSFLNHWVEMCEAEGNEAEFETAKKNFSLFFTTLKNTLETLHQLNVFGIPLLAPMIPEPDKED